jgi:hypothetical protein
MLLEYLRASATAARFRIAAILDIDITMTSAWGSAWDVDRDFIKTRLPQRSRLGYQACVEGHFAAVIDAETAAEGDTHSIELKPPHGET